HRRTRGGWCRPPRTTRPRARGGRTRRACRSPWLRRLAGDDLRGVDVDAPGGLERARLEHRLAGHRVDRVGDAEVPGDRVAVGGAGVVDQMLATGRAHPRDGGPDVELAGGDAFTLTVRAGGERARRGARGRDVLHESD